MRIFPLSEIRPLLENRSAVLEAVKQGFIAHSHGLVNLPTPMQMLFHRGDQSLSGDCHVKAASSSSYPYFYIKMASGFYDNPAAGLPVNNGLVMLLSSETGQPLAMFLDDGHMTSIRTAAAGALSALLVKDGSSKRLGIIGTGHQAELQARWICASMDITDISIWGRSFQKASVLAGRLKDLGLNVSAAATLEELCEQADIIVTATPSEEPILLAKDIRAGHHIIAMGADSPGKRELDPNILAKADVIITDDHDQCLEHGEFGWAVRAGLVDEAKDVSLGDVLEFKPGTTISSGQVSVVDLTGLGAQDLALASLVYEQLKD